MIAQGRYPAFTCLIRPFADNLNFAIPWLFYRTTEDAPGGIETVFTDRFWEEREHWESVGVGIVYGSTKPYFGPLPPAGIRGPISGTPDEWKNGLSFDKYVAGGYTDTVGCWPVFPGIKPLRLREVQEITARNAVASAAVIVQSQSLGNGVVAAPSDQVQSLTSASGPRADVDQAEQLLGGAVAFADQVEDFDLSGALAKVNEVQSLAGGASAVADVDQVEQLLGGGRTAFVDQVEQLLGGGAVADVDQVEQLLGSGATAFVDQEQEVDGGGAVADVDQEQSVEEGAAADVGQVQDLVSGTEAEADQVQDLTIRSAVTKVGSVNTGSNIMFLTGPPTGITAGMSISGPGIASGTTVSSTSLFQVFMSANATGNFANQTYTFV